MSKKGSHAKSIFESLPLNVDWSNRCNLGSNVGTIDAVAFSAIAAPALTVPMASIIAIDVMPMGTLSDDADVATSDAASLVAADPTEADGFGVAVGAPDPDEAASTEPLVVVDFPRKLGEINDTRF